MKVSRNTQLVAASHPHRWSCGTTSGCGIDGYEISVVRHYDRHETKSGRYLMRAGQLNGRTVATREEADALRLEYGYLKPYSRNWFGFRMTRAARRRGIRPTDAGYLRDRAYHAKRLGK